MDGDALTVTGALSAYPGCAPAKEAAPAPDWAIATAVKVKTKSKRVADRTEGLIRGYLLGRLHSEVEAGFRKIRLLWPTLQWNETRFNRYS